MNIRRIKNMLWLLGVMLFSASVWICVVGLRQPAVSSGDQGNSSRVQKEFSAVGQEVAVISLSAYEKAWSRSLRSAKVKQASVRKAPERKAPLAVTPNIKLVGTMVEDGNSFAIIEAKRGEHSLLGVGDILNQEIQVLTIESGRVEVMYRGQKYTLEAPKEKDGKQ